MLSVGIGMRVIDVIWDNGFMGGSTLQGKCSPLPRIDYVVLVLTQLDSSPIHPSPRGRASKKIVAVLMMSTMRKSLIITAVFVFFA